MSRISLGVVLFAFLLLAVPTLVNASCGAPSSFDPNAIFYQCVTITPSNTMPSNWIQPLDLNGLAYNAMVVNSIGSSISSITVSNGMILPAWIEGNILNPQQSNSLFGSGGAADVRIYINTENAIDTGGENIYVNFGSNTVNYLNKNTIGIAPQLYCTDGSCGETSYGQNDNGNNVFGFLLYQNFIGSSTPTGWTLTGTSGVINNGVIWTGSSSTSGIATTATFNSDNSKILEWYGILTSHDNADNFWAGFATAITSGTGNWWFLGGDGANIVDWNGATAGSLNPLINVYHIFSQVWNTATTSIFSTDYGTKETVTGSSKSNMVVVVGSNGDTSGNNGKFYWVRLRNYPSGGVYPIITNDIISTTPSLKLIINPTTVTYGSNSLITADCKVGDNCAVQSPLGTNLCTGTTTCSFTANYLAYGSGIYSFYANDLSLVSNSVANSLTINNAYPTQSCTHNTASLSSGQSFNSLGANEIISCTWSSINNQVTGSMFYNSILVSGPSASPSYNAVWNGQNNLITSNTPGNGNYFASSNTFNKNDVAYSITAVNYNSSGYETRTEGYLFDINITKAANTANVLLFANGNFVGNVLQSVLATDQIFTLTNSIPLLPTNNIPYAYNAELVLHLIGGGSLIVNPFTTFTQSELWNYYPSASAFTNNILIGSPQTVNEVIGQTIPLSFANVNSVVNIGNQSLGLSVLSTYSYYTRIPSFIPSSFALATPTPSNNIGSGYVTVTANVPVQLVYHNSVYRNQSTTFKVFMPNLVSCTAPNLTKAFTWSFSDITTPLTVFTNNVLLSGFYRLQNGAWSSNTINGTTAGFNSMATSNTYSTCITPFWGSAQTYGGFQYSAANYIQSQYYLINQATSNVLTNIRLYLTPAFANTSKYEIAVQNQTTLQYISTYVQVLKYDINSNTSILFTEFHTLANTGYVLNLQTDSYYKFVVYDNSGNLLTTTSLLQAECAFGSTCFYTIPIGSAGSSLIASQLLNLNYGCTNSTNYIKNVTTVSCTVQSINGTSIKGSLQIFPNGPLNNTASCINNATSASFTVTCSGAHVNNTYYTWDLFVWLPNYPQYQLANGNFGHQSSPFGNLGFFILFCVVIVEALLFIRISPVATLLLILISVGALTLPTGINLIVVSITAFGGLVLYFGAAIWALKKEET